ncbi:pyroglutamylated RFamide peptide receptor-like [Stylophora pistillata]|uniref:pyroglutamylated RFamide peptide receptor-like n=1 Tax=Stylophora pistillata TaxID=50429 RepID=UPI000C048594|nr:pyroglutamylated RFamide peptide receptor-like [Stylophora pistillata]
MISINSGIAFENIDASLVDFYIVFLLVIVFLSLISNITILTALYTQNTNLRSNMDVFIANIAVSDIISTFSATFTLNNAKLEWSNGIGTCKLCYFLVHASYAVMMFTLCLASIDRLYGICLPIRHRQAFLLKKPAFAITLIWILSCLLFAPYIYAYDVKEFKFPNGETKQICSQTWNSDSEQTFYSVVVLLLLFLAPIVLFIFVFVKVLHKLQEPRSTTSGGNAILHKKRRKMTCMLLLIRALQYLCCGPLILANTIHLFGQTSGDYFNIWLILELVRFLRCVTYLLIYLTMYQKIRTSLKALFSSCSSAGSQATMTSTSPAPARSLSQPPSVPASSAASDRSLSYLPEDEMYTSM